MTHNEKADPGEQLRETPTSDASEHLEGLAEEIRDNIKEADTAQREEVQAEVVTSFEDLRRTSIEATISTLDDVETVDDLRALPVERLIELEDKHEGILLYAFTDFAQGGDVLDLKHFEAFYRKPKPGTKLRVSFRGNPEAEAQIGAADIFPPSVQRITVYRQGDTLRARTSIRRVGLKGRNQPDNGFYDENGYMSVFSEDEVIVGGDKQSIGGIKPAFEQKYRDQGILDYEKYERERGKSDQEFLGTLPPKAERATYYGGSRLNPRIRRQLGLRGNPPGVSQNIEAVLRRQPDLYRYASQARSKYRAKTGLDIGEDIMFGVTHVESSFNVVAKNPKSSATGLLQFTDGTWRDYLSANPDIKDRMKNDEIWRDVDELEWRYNPEIMMDAGYWLATRNMKYLYSKRESIQYSEFVTSNFYKTGTIKVEDAWLLYLGHHEGPGGMVQILKYQGLRERDIPRQDAESQVKLADFQKKPNPDQHWRTVRGYAEKCTRWAGTYSRQMAALNLEDIGGDGSWGWAGDIPEEQVASGVDRYHDPLYLDQISKNPKLDGQTLFIGSSSTTGYAERIGGEQRIEAKSGRMISQMRKMVEEMPLSELRQFDRVVIQGGMKNQRNYETCVRDMTAMVAYLRRHAPEVKIYVVEVTPWGPPHTQEIERFNEFLHSDALDVDGVIPTYQAMDDGTGRLNSNFGKPGALHVARYDRYAGVLADWITRHEAAPDGVDAA